MVRNTKGDRRERELVNVLDDGRWAVMRAPASGGGTKRELPDILCGDGESFYAIELKSSGGDPIYVDEEEVTGLNFFANNFGAVSLIGVRFDRCDFYFFDPTDLYRTDSGNYRVKKSDLDDGIHVDDL